MNFSIEDEKIYHQANCNFPGLDWELKLDNIDKLIITIVGNNGARLNCIWDILKAKNIVYFSYQGLQFKLINMVKKNLLNYQHGKYYNTVLTILYFYDKSGYAQIESLINKVYYASKIRHTKKDIRVERLEELARLVKQEIDNKEIATTENLNPLDKDYRDYE